MVGFDMYKDYYKEKVYPNMIRKAAQVVYDGIKTRHEFKCGLENGKTYSSDHRYLCEYIYPKKIKKALNDLQTLYATQCDELEDMGIGSYDG